MVLVGAPYNADAGDNTGAAYIFERNAGGTSAWGEIAKLTASNAAANAYFGWQVSLAGDLALVGAYGDANAGTESGAACLFERNAGGTNAWGQVAKLTASDGMTNDWFGRAVSVDGDLLLIGAPQNDDSGNNSGLAYIFRKDLAPTPPVISNVTVQGSNVVCIWTSDELVDYSLQYNSNLLNGAWSDLPGSTNIPGQPTTTSATNTVEPNGEGFYRVTATNSPIR